MRGHNNAVSRPRQARYVHVTCVVCRHKHPRCTCRPLAFNWAGYPMQLQQQWHRHYLATCESKGSKRADRREAVRLAAEGYVQYSRKYHLVSFSRRVGTIIVEVTPEVLTAMRRLQSHCMHAGAGRI